MPDNQCCAPEQRCPHATRSMECGYGAIFEINVQFSFELNNWYSVVYHYPCTYKHLSWWLSVHSTETTSSIATESPNCHSFLCGGYTYHDLLIMVSKKLEIKLNN